MNKPLIRLAAAAVAVAAPGVLHAQGEDPTAWKVTAGANVALTSGNSESLLIGADVKAIKKWDKNEFLAGADLTYGESETLNVIGGAVVKTKDTTAQNFGGFLQYNRLFTDRWYGFINASGRSDVVADIDYRFTVGPGVGYYFIKNEKTTLAGEVGPSYVFEKVGGVEDDYLTIRFADKFTHKLSKTARIFQDAEYQPQVDDWGNYVITGSIGIEADINKHMALRVMFQDTYRSRPAIIAGTNPVVYRENNDLKLLAGITYKF
jgi:putative salt-induced outer membrane protein YdiY